MSYLQSEKHFRLYEPYIATIVSKWPQVVVLTPTPPVASPETLSSRIRICIKSLRDNQWSSSTIDMAKFIQICDEIIVSTAVKPGFVVCGPYDSIKKQQPHTPATVECLVDETQPIPVIRLNNPSYDLIKAVIVMHHHRLLSEPSEIITDCGDVMENWETIYDVAITRDGNKYTIL